MTQNPYTEKTLNGQTYLERLHGEVSDESPIILPFHWMTGTATAMDFLFENMHTPARLTFLQGEYPSGHEEGGYSWYPHGLEFYEKSDEEQGQLIHQTAEKIAPFIQSLKALYNGSVIVTGFSQGSDLSLRLATYFSDLIDLAIPGAGRLAEPMRPESVSGKLPIVRLHQGVDDEIVSVESARSVCDWLNENGFDATLDEYPGVGHNIDENMRSRIQENILSIG